MIPGTNPWTTATGLSAASDTGRSPRSRTASRSPFEPATRTAEPGGTLPAMSVAAACADVTTSADLAATPSLVRCSATADGEREALFVTKASRSPASLALVSAAGAPGIACVPEYTTPSRSSSATSYSAASGRWPGVIRVARAAPAAGAIPPDG